MSIVCQSCKNSKTTVTNSRPVENGVRRRRKCLVCNFSFSTYEYNELDQPNIDGMLKILSMFDRKLESIRIDCNMIERFSNEMKRKINDTW